MFRSTVVFIHDELPIETVFTLANNIIVMMREIESIKNRILKKRSLVLNNTCIKENLLLNYPRRTNNMKE